MSRFTFILIFVAVIVGTGLYFFSQSAVNEIANQSVENLKELITKEVPMKITSSAFQNNQSIPAKYSCDGEDVNPPLTFSELPDNTQSLVLIMDAPDAPAGTWVHWTIWNINPTTTEIAENSVPEGAVEGITSSGSAGYGGPCPPSGEHRYIFKLYALDAMLELDASADKAALEQEMQSYILGKADLTGLYRRQ